MAGERRQRFEEHQATLLALVGRVEALLPADPPDTHALALLRWELMRASMAYQGFKHRDLFDRAVASGTVEQARVARRLKADCIVAGEKLRAHVTTWSAVGVADRWPDCRRATQALVADLRAHLAREKRGAEPLFAEPPARAA